MSILPEVSSTIVTPNQGQTVHAFGDEMTVLLGAAETGGKFAVFTLVTPPGGGPPMHYHMEEDEWFYPLEGRAEFFVEDEWREVPNGSVVFMPRGTIHTFRNAGDTPLKMLIHTAPSGFETFFARCAEEFAKRDLDVDRISEISAQHGIFYVS